MFDPVKMWETLASQVYIPTLHPKWLDRIYYVLRVLPMLLTGLLAMAGIHKFMVRAGRNYVYDPVFYVVIGIFTAAFIISALAALDKQYLRGLRMHRAADRLYRKHPPKKVKTNVG